MTGRVIDLDDELLAAARREVTTSGVSDTVRAALRQAASARACAHRRAVLGHLQRGAGRAGVEGPHAVPHVGGRGLNATAVVVGPRGEDAALGVKGLDDLQSAGAFAADLHVDVVHDSRPELLVDVASRNRRHHGPAVLAEDLALGPPRTDQRGHRRSLAGLRGDFMVLCHRGLILLRQVHLTC